MWTPAPECWTTCATDTAAVAERLGHLGQHARLVVDLAAQVERALQVVQRQPVQLAVVAVVLQEAGAGCADHGEQVSDHRRGGLLAARPGPSRITSRIEFPRSMTALKAPCTDASGWSPASRHGCTRATTAPSTCIAEAISLT